MLVYSNQPTKDNENKPRQSNPAIAMNTLTSSGSPPTGDAPPTTTSTAFNVLVAGQAGIGKTGLIKLILDTSHLSLHSNSLPQLARLADFANFAATCPTNSPSSVLADLPATPNRPDIVLKLIDTPGLLYHDSHELEAGLHLVLRQILDSFEASNSLPSAQERRDRQIHLCLYLLDPADIVPASTRHLRRPERYGVSPQLTRQRVQLSAMRTAMTRTGDNNNREEQQQPEEMPHYDDSPEDEWGRATVPTSELNIIRKLAEYVTVLPIVAKADTLTTERLQTVKQAIRRDLTEAGITFNGLVEQQRDGPGQDTGPESSSPSSSPLLPYAVMIPDRYHHGDGVLRLGTAARPSHQQYVSRFQHLPVVQKESVYSASSPFVQRQDLVRTYRWGVVDILDPACSDFLALRDAILGPSVQKLRTYTDEVFFEAYKRNIVVDPRGQQQLPPMARPGSSGHALRSNPPHSLEGYRTHQHTHSSHHPRALNPSSSQYSLAPLENPPSASSRPNLPALTPLSTVLNPSLKYRHSNPNITSPDDDAPRSPGPSPIMPPKHRTGRKVAVACNFCRSRKLKCDGGRPQCLQCIRRTVDCEYEPTAKRRGLAKPADMPVHPGSGELSQPQLRGTSPTAHGLGSEQGSSSMPPKSVACQFCRARKTRCDGLQPQCSNCKKRNQECIYVYNTGYPEEETQPQRRFPPSTVGATLLPPIQSLPLGTALSDSLPSSSSSYWHSSNPQIHANLPPRRSHLSPPSRARNIPGTGSISQPFPSSSRSHQQHPSESDTPRSSFGNFPPPPPTTYPPSYPPETRRPSTAGAESQQTSWRDRSSFSSTSTRGGMSATSTTPSLKRKASHSGEIFEEGEGEVIRLGGESSPSPPKRRRISGVDELVEAGEGASTPARAATTSTRPGSGRGLGPLERRRSLPSREDAEEGESRE